jgi:hypothetical protein
MPRACTACRHPDRAGIDETLLAGRPYRDVAGRAGLSKSAVARHVTRCLAKVFAEERAERQRTLKDRLGALERRAEALLAGAEAAATRPGSKSADRHAAAALLRETRACLELAARLAGDLQPATVTVAVLQTPEWAVIAERITRALAPYRRASAAVTAALEEGYGPSSWN